LLVAPGFIDMHSHSDLSAMAYPDAESKISQGVTTEVTGNCGISTAPVNMKNQDLLRRYVDSFFGRVSNFLLWTTSLSEFYAAVVERGI